LMGKPIDFAQLDPATIPEAYREAAIAAWQERFETEFRSIQIMTRFMTEVVGAGDPIDVYAMVVDLIEDEVRHMALCGETVRALGRNAALPQPVAIPESDAFLAMPMPQRAMATAISMLAVNETLSCGFIEDLAARCEHPVIGAVLRATIEDEAEHQELGWAYIEGAMKRFPIESMSQWRAVVQDALKPQREMAEAVLAQIPTDQRNLDAWPEPELVEWGLFSPQRQALVFQQTWQDVLRPKLEALELL
jgi:hypothetical protein